MLTKRFKQWMAGSYPFQAVLLRYLSVCGETRVAVCQTGKAPAWSSFVLAEFCLGCTRIEGVGVGFGWTERK